VTSAQPTDFDLDAIRAEFPILGRKTYLNSCSLGALSKRSEAHLREFTERWHEMGASAWYSHWLGTVEELRARVAVFLGATPRELALLPSASTALAAVTESVRTDGRNRVVCTDLDFPTLAYQWAVKPEFELEIVRSPDGLRIDPAQLADAVDERTLFLATSHVYFTTGYAHDLSVLAEIARTAGAYSLVDGYQGPGQVEVSLPDTGVDFYTSGPLKWLLGGPGLAYLYVRDELVERLQPRLTSWFATKHQFDFDLEGFEYRDDARRFELGTPALPTIHTALGGQEIIEEVGIDTIARRNRHLTDRLVQQAEAAGFDLRLAEPGHRTSIVMIAHDDPPGAVKHLANNGVIVDYRPGFVRVSPHFYNTEADVDHCVRMLAAYGG
jgi:kynureninase